MSRFKSFLRNLLVCGFVASSLSSLSAQALSLTFSGVNPTCHNYTNGIATVSVAGGSGTYYYQWNNAQGGSSNLGLPAGTYSITVTDAISGVTAVGSTTLTHPPQINGTIDPVNGSCGLFNGNLCSTVNGGTGAYSYAWSNGATTATQTGASAGGYYLTVTDANGCSDIDFRQVAPQPNMFANFLITQPICSGNANGSISNVNIIGNFAPFTYVWPNGTANQALNGIPGGTYQLVMTDANGCTIAQPITVQDPSPLVAITEKEDSKCAMTCDGVVKVFVSGGVAPYSILWSNGSTNSVVFPLPPGQYDVTVTDANGCQAFGSETILEPTPIEINQVAVSGACGGNTGSLTVNATGGVAPYTYLWNYNNITGPSLNGVPSGTYWVLVSDANNCQKSLPFTVPGNGGLNVSITVASALCAGQSNGSATAYANGGSGNYTYQWSAQSFNGQSINGLLGGSNVSVTVTDITTGCEGTASAHIGVHQAIFVGLIDSDVLCNTSINGSATANATNGAAPYSYAWTIPGIGVVNSPTVSNLGVGAYTVVVTDANGCTASNVANITNTDQIQASISINDSGCDQLVQTQFTANGTGIQSYQWVIGGQTYNTPSPSVTLPSGLSGVAQLVVTSANGCTATASQGFTVSGDVLDVALSTNNLSGCENTPLNLTAINNNPASPVNFTWYTSSNGITIQIQNQTSATVSGSAGNYTVFAIATGLNGCIDTLQASVTLSDGQSLSNVVEADLCLGREVAFNNTTNLTGVWSFGDGTTSTDNDPTHNYAQGGTYTVTFTPSAACTAPFDTMITVLDNPAVQASFLVPNILTCDSVAIFEFTNTSIPATGLTYLWNLGPVPTSTVPNPTVTYTTEGPVTAILTATDAKGCSDTASVTFPFHIIDEDVNPTSNFCIDNPVELNPVFNATYDYTWASTPLDPSFDIKEPNPTVQPTVQTTYSVTITIGGCQVVRSVVVTPNPDATLAAPNDVNSCINDAVNLTASSTNGTIIWANNPNFTNPTSGGTYSLPAPVASGSIYIKVTTPAGCTLIDTVDISVEPVDIDYETNQPIAVCAGGSLVLEIENTDLDDVLTYQWTGGLPPVSNPGLAPTASGTYTATVTNQYGCTTTAQFVTNYVALSVTVENIGKDTICPGEKTELSATPLGGSGYTYTWSPSILIESTDDNVATVSATSNQVFVVTVTDQNGCSASANTEVMFRNLTCARPFVFLPSAFTPNDDTHNDRIMVRGVNIEKLYFVIYDRWGEKVFITSTTTDAGWDGTFKGTILSPDSYGYYFKAECTGGEVFEETGNVTLLR
jgi:gliding motility-associated-like protein